MTCDLSKQIAEEFIESHNPNHWNGAGTKDKSFTTDMEVYRIFTEDVYMTIQFEIDPDEGGRWAHEVKLYRTQNDELIDGYFGYGIDSPQNLADTIMDICREYNLQEQIRRTPI